SGRLARRVRRRAGGCGARAAQRGRRRGRTLRARAAGGIVRRAHGRGTLMIYQLIRRDPAWKTALVIGPAALLLALIPRLSGFGPLAGFLFTGCLLFGQPHRRATIFEAALPISSRDLVAARLAALLSAIWFPTLAASAVLW